MARPRTSPLSSWLLMLLGMAAVGMPVGMVPVTAFDELRHDAAMGNAGSPVAQMLPFFFLDESDDGKPSANLLGFFCRISDQDILPKSRISRHEVEYATPCPSTFPTPVCVIYEQSLRKNVPGRNARYDISAERVGSLPRGVLQICWIAASKNRNVAFARTGASSILLVLSCVCVGHVKCQSWPYQYLNTATLLTPCLTFGVIAEIQGYRRYVL